jgi:GrpB-like predicted nucleotidyltransferase (UPF0157 family)
MSESEMPRPAHRAPTTEEELRAVTVGDLQPLSGPILLTDYDPNWPAQFEREAERIGAVLGHRVLRIEHVGSTSVPGLAAKPIIDILLVVEDATAEGAFVPALDAAGYRLRIREDEHRMFKGPGSTSTCTSSLQDIRRSTACSPFATGCVPCRLTASCTCRPSASWPGGGGGTCRTTPTPRLRSSRRSSREPAHGPRFTDRSARIHAWLGQQP